MFICLEVLLDRAEGFRPFLTRHHNLRAGDLIGEDEAPLEGSLVRHSCQTSLMVIEGTLGFEGCFHSSKKQLLCPLYRMVNRSRAYSQKMLGRCRGQVPISTSVNSVPTKMARCALLIPLPANIRQQRVITLCQHVKTGDPSSISW